MKTAEQIAGQHFLSSCSKCSCAFDNGGVCKRLVGMIEEGIMGALEAAKDALPCETGEDFGFDAAVSAAVDRMQSLFPAP